MKRLLAVGLVLLAGCDFRGSGKKLGSEVVVYSESPEPARGWCENPEGGYLSCHPPVGQKAVWLGSGFKVEGQPGEWDRVRISWDKGEGAVVYLPATALRPVPR